MEGYKPIGWFSQIWKSKGERQTVATSISATELPGKIKSLLQQREHHLAAIGQIDKTLAGVAAALGSSPALSTTPPTAVTVSNAKQSSAFNGKRRGSYANSATDLVLAFLKVNKSPTSKEITQHLADQGRSAGATSNALSVLTAAKRLKRTPLGKGKMGSTYSLA